MGILVRSIVMATAAISTAPKTILCANMLTPRNVIPMRTTEMIKAPASVRQVLPTPPRYRGSADDDRGDRRQQEFGRQGRRPAREPAGEDDASERCEAGGENKGEDLLLTDLHAGS